LKRSEKRQEMLPIDGGRALEAQARELGLAPVAQDRFLYRARAAVVKKRPADAKTPERGRPDFFGSRRRLRDAVPGSDVVQQQVRKERHRLSVEQRIAARPGRQRRYMTRGAPHRVENAFSVTHHIVDWTARNGRQEFHERLEVVDAAPARHRIAYII